MSQSENGTLEGLAICEENMLVNADAASSGDIVRQLGSLLHTNGFVQDTFVQAVIDREKAYPTGLQTSILGFAIPHTDTEHVIRPGIAVATLSQPVEFQAMGDPATGVSVKIVMMLAISDPKAVVHVLRKVISILEDEAALQALTSASTRQEVRNIIQAHIQRMADKIPDESPAGSSPT